jgi:hypothetical protein
MKSLPFGFIVFCLAVLAGLAAADARGYLVASLFTGAQSAPRTFASHYHK